MVGICSYGGYVPRYRLNRGRIYEAMGWMNSANIAHAGGEKAVANYDEDSITLAVAAGQDCLKGTDPSAVEGLYFSSTTMPYKERLNAGIMTVALGMEDQVRAADFSGGLKAGTTALISALEAVESKMAQKMLVCSSDCRLGQPASPQEMVFGDGAAALLVGAEDVIAEYKGYYSITYDFVDHYRGEFAKFDRQWEDRWIRDLGFDQLIPEAINGLLKKYQLNVSDFSRVIYPCQYTAARRKLNKSFGISPTMEQKNFQAEIGETGTPHALIMLVSALEEAKPGDKLLVVSFGSGCDALYFEVTEKIMDMKGRMGISGCLANRAELDNYTKYLVWRNTLPAELGLRAEEDLWTRWSSLWRSRKTVLGLYGSKCKQCGTPQFPPQQVCVNPDCKAVSEMEAYRFADKTGKIGSYTGDMLAASYDPPAIYGAIQFEGGGKCYFDFTDCNLDSLSTGMSVTMSFRKKYYDKKRDIVGYFWKAVPLREE